jgi:hypothetical protein
MIIMSCVTDQCAARDEVLDIFGLADDQGPTSHAR